ncbi:MAG: MucB/RseB C-terminal domain-containing protein [Proteobacteria bacterium]|nr:MucB/RseB C-terminal domain-containing protein [Pseudomonadota bacterium]
MNFILRLSLLLLVLTSIGQANAGPAMEWVQKMADAMRNKSYQGNFVYLHENQLESMSISHIKDSAGERERLFSLNGEAREVIRDNKNLTCIWPLSRKVIVDSSRQNNFSPLFIPDDVARIEKFYDMKIIGHDRIADYQTVVVEIVPKDQLRYGLKLWINTENELLMKSSLIDEQGRVVEQVMFTSLELLPEEDRLQMIRMPELDDSYTLVRYHSGDVSGNMVADVEWQLSSIPDGFRRQSALKREIPETGRYIQQLVYTDGLASLSIFIEKLSSSPTLLGGTSMGAVNAYIRVLDDYSVTAIGEVPALTIRRVAESVFYSKP